MLTRIPVQFQKLLDSKRHLIIVPVVADITKHPRPDCQPIILFLLLETVRGPVTQDRYIGRHINFAVVNHPVVRLRPPFQFVALLIPRRDRSDSFPSY